MADDDHGRGRNRLAASSSPYLLQHATNPVDWYPWGPEAFEAARRRDVPIFLSVGYAACHWCHVMERESFEDDATAALLNEHFVAIKVDREERPDVDGIYMDAVQALTGQGGWPMSAFLTPDGEPFYAGTYFPPAARHGMPAFADVLRGIAEAWRERRDAVADQGKRVARAIAAASRTAPGGAGLDEDLLDRATEALRRTFDARWGGFGGAPKFPQPMSLEFLLRRGARGSVGALEMVTTTLDRMAAGGIYDHVGGGFARYSTDERWLVPHFEKMLYDNALLLQLYTRAWQVTGHDRYRTVARETADYVLRELRQPDGGFSSSQDADTEGEEGATFTWSWAELLEVAGERVARALGAVPHGNWASEHGPTNVLWRPTPLEELAEELDISVGALRDEVAIGRAALFASRELRPQPATDDKVLASWNGMAIGALAEAGRALDEPRYVESALAAARFVLERLRDADGRLLRSWRRGVTGVPGFADDHASMGSACLTLYETTFDVAWFERAVGLAAELREAFADTSAGGFFQTRADGEALLVRPRELMDNATPSGNSVGADLLLRLAAFTGDADLEEEAARAMQVVSGGIDRAPGAFGHALCVVDRSVGPGREVAIVGDPGADAVRALTDEVTAHRFRPNTVIAAAAADDDRARLSIPLLHGRTAIDGRPTAYVCERFTCRLPVHDPAELRRQLDEVAPE